MAIDNIISFILGAVATEIVKLAVPSFWGWIMRIARNIGPKPKTPPFHRFPVDAGVNEVLAAELDRRQERFWAMGRIIELERAPNLKKGWRKDTMSFNVETDSFSAIEPFQALYAEWKRDNSKNPDKGRYVLTDIAGPNTSDNPFLALGLKRSTFGMVYSIGQALDRTIEIEPANYQTPRSWFHGNLLNPSSPLPKWIVFHVLVRTLHGKGHIILQKRSREGHYWKDHLSASFEEQLDDCDFLPEIDKLTPSIKKILVDIRDRLEEDSRLCETKIDDPNLFIRGVLRGLCEEFAIQKDDVRSVKLMSLFVDYTELHCGCCVLVDVDLSPDAILERWKRAPDRREGTVFFMSSEFEHIVQALALGRIALENVGEAESSTQKWHSSTGYRLFMFGASEYGENAILRAIDDFREKNSDQYARQ